MLFTMCPLAFQAHRESGDTILALPRVRANARPRTQSISRTF